jgi:hypothetical protein
VLDHSTNRGECLHRTRDLCAPGSEFAHLFTGPDVTLPAQTA